MADTQAQHHPQYQQQMHRSPEGTEGLLPNKGSSASQVMAVAALFPVGGILLTLSGITLTGTIIALAVATPLFVIFSPVLLPAAIAIGLAVTGFLASGAFGLTGISSLSYILNYLGGVRGTVPEQMDYAKRRMQEAAGHIGQRAKDVGQGIQSKAEEGGRTRTHEGGGRK